MILEQKRHGKKEVDDKLVLTVLSGATLAILLWICIAVSDIQTDLKEIHNTLDIIEETLKQDGVLLDSLNKHLKVICYVGQKQIECP